MVIDPTAIPEIFGLSSHSNVRETSPLSCPFTINFVPSSENFAESPGEVEVILNFALISNPLFELSSNSIVFPLLTTLLPAVGDALLPYSILYSLFLTCDFS